MMEEKLSIRTKILELQSDYLFKKAKKDIGEFSSEEDLRDYANTFLKSFYSSVGGPLLQNRKAESGHVPFAEDFEMNTEEVAEDLSILYSENESASQFLQDSFNYAQSERKRLLSRVNGLNSLVGDLNLIAHENKDGNLYFKESFESKEAVDENANLPNVSKAQVSVTEGVLTLARNNTVNLSLEASVRKAEGNGEAGTSHVVRRIQVVDERKKVVEKNVFINSNDELKNDEAQSLLDSRPDTIFEYQTVNVPNDFVKKFKGYDFNWVKGKEEMQKLRLQLIIELKELSDVNWLNINPYYPVNSTGKVKVYSIKTSQDGFEYQGLYTDKAFVLNNELNEVAQTYRVDDLFDGKNEFDKAKFAGQGVWSFPTRKAKYIEIIFDQVDSYKELIGQAVYYKKTVLSNKQEIVTQIPEPKELKEMEPGDNYRIPAYKDDIISKVIEATIGWRYVIGLRDVNIMSYRFDEKSMYISKRFDVDGDISKVMLYANEKIPEKYLERIETSNDWIQYEVSFDDVNWMPISPMHHEPAKENFPAKIIEVNGSELDLGNAFQIHKSYVKVDQAKSVRLRITLSRPKGEEYASSTPILEDYALRIIKRGETV